MTLKNFIYLESQVRLCYTCDSGDFSLEVRSRHPQANLQTTDSGNHKSFHAFLHQMLKYTEVFLKNNCTC